MLEVLVALTVLAIGGSALMSLVAASQRTAMRLQERESTFLDANALLAAISLWPRDDLERRLGTRDQGRFRVRIDRLTPYLFEVVVGDSAGTPLIGTRIHRE